MGATSAGFVPHITVNMTAGAALVLEIAIQDPDDSSAVPLSLADARWQLVRDGAQLTAKELGDGVEVTDALGGIVQVTLVSGDTTDLGGYLCQDELELTHIDGRVEPGVAFGLVNIRDSLLIG